MLKTFNCGVGFCLIINPKNFKQISKFFFEKISAICDWKNHKWKK